MYTHARAKHQERASWESGWDLVAWGKGRDTMV